MIEWSRVIENAAPAVFSALLVSVLMLFLNHRASRRLESYKTELQLQLANERARIEESVLRRSAWYEKRSAALVELYGAFYAYLDFLRRHLYFEQRGGDLTPMHDFRRACDSLSVFLTDDLKTRVDQYAGELLQFWNWAVQNQETELEEIRRRLDYEIPGYLDRLRTDIGRYLEEVPSTEDEAAS
jgi:hypothetical protein